MSVENRLGRPEKALPRPRWLSAHVAEEPISTMLPRFLRYLYLDRFYADEGPDLHEAIWRELELLPGPEVARLFGYEMRVMPKRKRDAACMVLSRLPTWPAEGEST